MEKSIKEVLTSKRTALALTLALGIGTSACSSGEAATQHPKKQNVASASNPANPTQRKTTRVNANIYITYFPDGTREINLGGAENESSAGLEDIYQFCVDENLYSESESAGSGTAPLTITQNYSPCSDDKLTPSDFAPGP
jgi:hypothetical protein